MIERRRDKRGGTWGEEEERGKQYRPKYGEIAEERATITTQAPQHTIKETKQKSRKKKHLQFHI